MGHIIPDPDPNSTGQVVAVCHDLIGSGTYYPYSTKFNKGSCY